MRTDDKKAFRIKRETLFSVFKKINWETKKEIKNQNKNNKKSSNNNITRIRFKYKIFV